MSLLKPKGRTVRIDESMLPLLERLRALMLNTAHSSGLKINRADVPSDGVVVGFALTMTEILMDPKFAFDRPRAVPRHARQGSGAARS